MLITASLIGNYEKLKSTSSFVGREGRETGARRRKARPSADSARERRIPLVSPSIKGIKVGFNFCANLNFHCFAVTDVHRIVRS